MLIPVRVGVGCGRGYGWGAGEDATDDPDGPRWKDERDSEEATDDTDGHGWRRTGTDGGGRARTERPERKPQTLRAPGGEALEVADEVIDVEGGGGGGGVAVGALV